MRVSQSKYNQVHPFIQIHDYPRKSSHIFNTFIHIEIYAAANKPVQARIISNPRHFRGSTSPAGRALEPTPPAATG